MSAIQPHSETFNPNELNLIRVGTYQRIINASLERVWENVLDWEHLPWLHHTSFDYIEVEAAGAWGWRTWSNADKTSHIELTVADDSSYVARTYQSDRQVSEIWTRLEDQEGKTAIEVSFWLPDVEDSQVDAFGNAMVSVYTTLWDEDEAMMMERQRRLDEQRDRDTETFLGDASDLRTRLANSELICFQLKGREFQLRLVDDAFVTHASICPHLLGPLADSPIIDNQVTCPWHGYRFDIGSGECRFPTHARCRLPEPPTLVESDGQLIARAGR